MSKSEITALRPNPFMVLVKAALIFGLSALAGLVLLVILFKFGLFSSLSIIFYRGLVICAVVSVVLVLGLYFVARQPLRDALAAAVLSLGLNISFVVIAPVTVDRSISVFMLGYMTSYAEKPLSAHEMAGIFEQKYIIDMQQIDRRMAEQVTSGNLEQKGDGYVVTEQGRGFIRTAKWIAWLFNTDTRFVTPEKIKPDTIGGQ